MTPGWPSEHKELATRLAAQGCSAGVIKDALHNLLNVDKSRSSIVGWCARNKVALLGNKRKERSRNVLKRCRAAKLPEATHVAPDPDFRIDTDSRTAGNRHCKFPYGEPKDFRICGCQTVPGRSYCIQHFRECYQNAKI